MLVNTLCTYYDKLVDQNKLAEDGFTAEAVRSMIVLKENGDIADIVDIREEVTIKVGNKEKKIKRMPTMLFPWHLSSSHIKAYDVDKRGSYIFGCDKPDAKMKKELKLTKNELMITETTLQKHALFVEKNLKFVEGIDSPVVNAYRAFLNNYDASKALDDERIVNLINEEAISKGFCITLEGHPDKLLNEDKQVKQRIRELYAASKEQSSVEGTKIVDSVTGVTDTLARTHQKVSGIYGSSTAGGDTLFCVNNACGESYNQQKGEIANITETTMLKYSKALHYLLNAVDETTNIPMHKTALENITVLFYTLDKDKPVNTVEDVLFNCMTTGGAVTNEAETVLKDMMYKVKNGLPCDFSQFKADYVICGILSNSGRIAVKFFYRNSFEEIFKNIVQHQKDFAYKLDRAVSMYDIMRELKPRDKSGSSTKSYVQPAVVSSIFTAVYTGSVYPYDMLSSVIHRILVDHGKSFQLNDMRIAIIKAYLNRKNRLNGIEEEIGMDLDTTNTNRAYNCGRLFALLEKLQYRAMGRLNSSIRDSHFTAACTTPFITFPQLLTLANAHMTKLRSKGYGGLAYYYDAKIGEIMLLMGNEFPDNFEMEDKGRFMCGYYQQRYSAVTKAEESEAEPNVALDTDESEEVAE